MLSVILQIFVCQKRLLVAPHKSDPSGTSTELLKMQLLLYIISECVAALFTALFRYGYMPEYLRSTVPSATTVDSPLMHSLANISVMP